MKYQNIKRFFFFFLFLQWEKIKTAFFVGVQYVYIYVRNFVRYYLRYGQILPHYKVYIKSFIICTKVI